MNTPTSNANPPCETCRFWRKWDSQGRAGGVFGECRKLSPVVILVRANSPGPDRPVSKWPTTRSNDWCGRHRSVDASPITHRGDYETSETHEPSHAHDY